MAFVDIPLDVVIEISRELDLADSLHLIATCTIFMPILHSRYFWIAALNRLEDVHRRPPPYFPGLDILSLPLASLRELAIHGYKLKKDWSSESPRPISVKIIEMEDCPKQLIAIQGTRLLITISSTRLACWDTLSGKCIGSFYHEAKPCNIDGISPFSIPGSVAIGMIYETSSANAFELAIIYFDCRNSLAAQGSKAFSTIWTAPDTQCYYFSDVAVNQTTIAACVYDDDDMAFLLICRLEDGIIHSVPLGSNAEGSDPKCIILKDAVYITRQYFDATAGIIRVQTSAPKPHALDFQVHTAAIPIPFSNVETIAGSAIGFCNPRFPQYGVLNITLRTSRSDDDDDEVINSLHFWPAQYDGSKLAVDSLCFYEHPCDIVHVAVGSSATCGVTLDEAHSLGLVQYYPNSTPHVEFRPLYVPDIEVKSSWSMALDDRLGVLYMGDPWATGVYCLFVVSYV
ncbi:hypothetical protein B0H19DRAFT_1138789 [Mycena capillaripes]|nr:hypothetical protein B0H19DRAFT_1138789 [Mycena capillaripes]